MITVLPPPLPLLFAGGVQLRGQEGGLSRAQALDLIASFNSGPTFLAYLNTNRQRFKQYSLSHVLAYSAEQLSTAYSNNIIAHFACYVRRFVQISLRLVAIQEANVQTFNAIPVVERRSINQQIQWAVADILGWRLGDVRQCTRAAFVDWLDVWQAFLIPQPRPDASFDDYIEARPFDFLPYMVSVNNLLEAFPNGTAERVHTRTSLFSPLALRSSFIPTHLTLDTTAILHLFVDNIDHFKQWYSRKFNEQLPGLESKQDLAAAFSKLARRPVSKLEEAEHASRCWQYAGLNMPQGFVEQKRMIKKKTSGAPAAASSSSAKQTKRAVKQSIAAQTFRDPDDYESTPLRFQRMVMTDGYCASVLLTTAADVKGRVLAPRARRPRPMSILDGDTYSTFAHLVNQDSYNIVACDPGKKRIVTMQDGQGKVIDYTLARRQRECRHLLARRKTETKKALTLAEGYSLPLPNGDVLVDPSITQIEQNYLSHFTNR